MLRSGLTAVNNSIAFLIWLRTNIIYSCNTLSISMDSLGKFCLVLSYKSFSVQYVYWSYSQWSTSTQLTNTNKNRQLICTPECNVLYWDILSVK